MAFFELVTGDYQWVLGAEDKFADGRDVDVWAYGRCERVTETQPVPFVIDAAGPKVDFNPTAYTTIVISRKLGDLLRSILPNDAVQFLPAQIEGATGDWEVLNILSCVDCLDRQRSLVEYFPADHPEKAGKPRSVMRLIVDPSKAVPHDLFRVDGWSVVVVASERLKRQMESAGITGVEYWRVSP